jgi:hypothetical protein
MNTNVRTLFPDPDDVARRGGALLGEARQWAIEAWLARVGPAAMVCWRLLACQLVEAGGPVTIDLVDFAARLGVSVDGGTTRIRRLLDRLEHFGLITVVTGGWRVRLSLPLLAPHHLRLLPERIRDRYCRGVATVASSTSAHKTSTSRSARPS